MLWAALLLSPRPDASQPCNDALHGLAVWALQFTPRVATVHEAVVMEVQASLRLLGGKRALRERVVQEASDLGVVAIAWAPNSLAALALARAGVVSGLRRPLADVLDALPLETLSETAPHRTTLSQLGCQTLGCLRRLPRGGINRRFGKELLSALDQAYGLRPELHAWVTLPERFIGKLELMSRVELAPAMLFGARRLLRQLCGWLAARQAGTTAIRLSWAHDAMRSRSAGEGGALDVRTADPTRDIEHLHRLLAEHLAKVTLAAPVGDLELQALDVQAMAVDSDCLLPESVRPGESLTLVLERLAARLGPERVLRPVLAQEHRLEWMQHWQPAPQALPRKSAATTSLPQPTFVLAEPLRLACKGDQPMYQGVLQLLSGPHRIEGGWWHRIAHADGECTGHVQRDYWVAFSEHTGVLWIFQGRLASDETAWYLHGSFA